MASPRKTGSKAEGLSQNFLQAVFDSMGEGLYAIDVNGCVTLINPAAERMLGWKAREILGRNMHETAHYKYPDGTPFPRSECRGFRVFSEKRTISVADDWFVRKSGELFPVSYTSSPIFRDNAIAGAVVAFRDLTETHVRDLEFAKAEERLRQVSQIVNVGRWEMDADDDQLWVSEEAVELLGITSGDGRISVADLLEKVFLEGDRRRVRAAFTKAPKTRQTFQLEFRIRRAEDEVRYLLCSGRSFFNRGSAVTMGIFIDVTEAWAARAKP